MSDIVWVAAIGLSGTVAVAVGNVFGPGWIAKRQRENQRRIDQQNERFARLSEFLEAIVTVDPGFDAVSLGMTLDDAWKARQRFVATLRAGEGAAASFTTWMLETVRTMEKDDQRSGAVYQCGDRLYAWLRGDKPISSSERRTLLADIDPDVS